MKKLKASGCEDLGIVITDGEGRDWPLRVLLAQAFGAGHHDEDFEVELTALRVARGQIDMLIDCLERDRMALAVAEAVPSKVEAE